MGLTFSYDLVDSDESNVIYQQMLEDDVVKVLTWSLGRYEPGYPVEDTVKVWWLTKGPTAFASVEDSVRYRKELTAAVLATVLANKVAE